MLKTLPQRTKAAGIHLGISAAIFAVALYLIVVRWYPGFHFTVDGGWQGVRIMAAVDLVLGPTLTLVVFNPLKARRLIVFDLACIGLAQLGALVWGFYAVHSQHPVAISWSDGRIHVVTAEPLQVEQFDIARLADLSDQHPALVYSRPPANDDEEARAAMQEVMGTVAAYEDPLFFTRFADHWPDVRAKALDATKAAKESRAFREEWPEFLHNHGGAESNYLLVPYSGRYGNCMLAFTASGELVDALGCEKI